MADTPTWTYEILWYLNTGTASSPSWAFVDYDNAFDPSADNEEYAPKWKARKTQPTFVTGRKYSIDFDIDLVEGSDIGDFMLENEDDVNVPVEVLRVWKTGSSPYKAKKAAFQMTESPIDGAANEPARATGTMTMLDDGWTNGTATLSGNTPSFSPTV